MPDQSVEQLFAVTVSTTGDRYVDAREAILEMHRQDDASVSGPLGSFSEIHPEWQAKLAATILQGWIQEPELYRQCSAYMQGRLLQHKPMGGFTSGQRADAIATLGKQATPRILEILWKTGEHKSDVERSALFGALVKLEDPQAIPLMEEFIEEGSDSEYMKGGLRVLVGQKAPGSFDRALELARDQDLHGGVRVYAIRTLAMPDDPRASTELLRLLGEQESGTPESVAAARALKERKDPETRDEVVVLLERNWTEAALIPLIQLLRDIGTEADIPAVERLALFGPEVEEEVEEAVEEIQQRSGRR